MFNQITAFQGEEHKPFFWNGGARAALLVHGFPGTPAEMRPLAEILHDQGWTVQGILLPGFGADIGTLGRRSANDWVNAVGTALAELGGRRAPVLLVGHSMGGAIAIQAAVRQPVDGLVLVSPFWKLTGGGPIRFLWPLIRRLIPQFKPFRLSKPDFVDARTREGIHQFLPDADLDDPAVRQAIRDFAIPTRLIGQVMATGAASYAVAAGIRVPALVIQGREDRIVRPAYTRDLAGRLGGSVQYHEIDGGHDLLERDQVGWEDVSRLVLAFTQTIIHSPHRSPNPAPTPTGTTT